MSNSGQLETLAHDSAIQTTSLNDHSSGDGPSAAPGLTFGIGNTTTTLGDEHGSKGQALKLAEQLHSIPTEPLNFIQHLAKQNQLLACLKWLSQFQVLACIPLDGSISTAEVAELVGVPENYLSRITRFTATAGFLREPQPGHLAHTDLSSPFVTNFAFLDAVVFLTETAVPTGMQMPVATHSNDQTEMTSASAYSTAFNNSTSFQAACEDRSKLQRQWVAYRQCAGDVEDSAAELFTQLNWQCLGDACVVVACAESVNDFVFLSEMYPSLRFIVQMNESAYSLQSNGLGNPESHHQRITVQKRPCGAMQPVTDAAAYILRLRSPLALSPAQIQAELTAHLDVLAANTQTTLILAPPLLPQPGSVEPRVEAVARMSDLLHLQLANSSGLEVGELIELVNSVRDSRGCLIVINTMYSRDGLPLALAVKYEAYANASYPAPSQ